MEVKYLTFDFEPTTEENAEMIVMIYDDGSRTYAFKETESNTKKVVKKHDSEQLQK